MTSITTKTEPTRTATITTTTTSSSSSSFPIITPPVSPVPRAATAAAVSPRTIAAGTIAGTTIITPSPTKTTTTVTATASIWNTNNTEILSSSNNNRSIKRRLSPRSLTTIIFVAVQGCILVWSNWGCTTQQFSLIDDTNQPRIVEQNQKQQKQQQQGNPFSLFLQQQNRSISIIKDDVVGNDNNNDFLGIIPKSFPKWTTKNLYKNNKTRPFPCFPPEDNWKHMDIQNRPSTTGFFYVKPFKTGSSTTSGITLRIARNVAQRLNKNYAICKSRFDHGPDVPYPANILFLNRIKSKSFLWSSIRDPTQRAISMFFHMEVSRKKVEPNLFNFKKFLMRKGNYTLEDYYIRTLHTTSRYKDRYINDPIKVSNIILKDYDFIGITERMDETAVILMMILDIKMADILYLSAKTHGNYDEALNGECTYLWPKFITNEMKQFINSDEWKERIKYDLALYNTVNKSLDLTIDKLGRNEFNENLKKFKYAQSVAKKRCSNKAIWPCDKEGRFTSRTPTDCLFKDSGCGKSCLDQVATKLNLW